MGKMLKCSNISNKEIDDIKKLEFIIDNIDGQNRYWIRSEIMQFSTFEINEIYWNLQLDNDYYIKNNKIKNCMNSLEKTIENILRHNHIIKEIMVITDYAIKNEYEDFIDCKDGFYSLESN